MRSTCAVISAYARVNGGSRMFPVLFQLRFVCFCGYDSRGATYGVGFWCVFYGWCLMSCSCESGPGLLWHFVGAVAGLWVGFQITHYFSGSCVLCLMEWCS